MCGRYVTASTPDELSRYFGARIAAGHSIAPSSTVAPSYNVAPTDDVYVVRSDGHTRLLDTMRWGLVPPWADDLAKGARMINARAETVATSNAFRRPLAERRCLIPADGFYEWTAVPGRARKQPWYIHRPDGEAFAFAGLWERWRRRGDPILSCAIITGPANDTMARLHDRMPVMLPGSAWDRWLDPHVTDPGEVTTLLVPAPEDLIAFHRVGPDVGNVRSNGHDLIEPLDSSDTPARGDDMLLP